MGSLVRGVLLLCALDMFYCMQELSSTCFRVYWCIGAVRLEEGGIRVQVGALLVCACGLEWAGVNNTPTYSRRLLRMNVITFETC